METFYLVWEPIGGYCKHRHETEMKAEKEAQRLAMEYPEKEFYVLRALTMSTVIAPVKTIELTDLLF